MKIISNTIASQTAKSFFLPMILNETGKIYSYRDKTSIGTALRI